MTTIKERINYVKIFNIISAILMLALIICQVTPFWQVEDHKVSIQGYICLPEDHVEILEYIKSETNPETEVNDIIGMPVIVLISGVVGAYFCFFMREKALCAILPGICGIAGVIGYLTNPAYQLGHLWGLHLILCFAILAAAIATLICWRKAEKVNSYS